MTETADTATTDVSADTTSQERDTEPLVSAVITTYNRPSYLRRAVRSVRDQTYDNIELVVVDDHSDTPAREELSDVDLDPFGAFQIVRHDTNRGANAARNTGISACSGEYVALLDDDDRWVPEKIERQVETFLDGRHELGVVYTGVKEVMEGGTREKIPRPIEGDITRELLCRNVVGSMSLVMVRADLAKEIPLDERFPAWADLEWYVRLSQAGDFQHVPEPLVIYDSRSHNRLSADVHKKQTAYELFVEEFESLAEEYGALFARKMRGWAAYRLGSSAYYRGQYSTARRYLLTAVLLYPFEPEFLKLVVASAGGKPVHKTVRFLKENWIPGQA